LILKKTRILKIANFAIIQQPHLVCFLVVDFAFNFFLWDGVLIMPQFYRMYSISIIMF